MDARRVLVIEDDQEIAQLIRAILTNSGCVVFTAANGREGLESIPACEPELILVDMHMPVMNGWQFAEEFHARYESRIPMVVFTAFDDAEKIAESVGAQAYVSKPFGVKDLLATVKQFV